MAEIKGMTAFLNPSKIKKDKDFESTENKISSNSSEEPQNKDSAKNFQSEISKLMSKLQLDSGDGSSDSESRSSRSTSSARSSSRSSRSSRSEDSRSSRSSGSSRSHRIRSEGWSKHEESEDPSRIGFAEVQHRKAQALANIKSLMGVLDSEGYDLKDVVMLTEKDNLEDIEHLMKRLDLMKNSSQYSTIAEEMMIGAASVIEYVFDGQNKIPGTNFAPDYTNYSNTLTIRLRSMRYETSQIIGNVFEQGQYGPVSKMLISLLPGFLLYPAVNKNRTKGNDLTQKSTSAKNARTEINTSDSRINYNKQIDVLNNL